MKGKLIVISGPSGVGKGSVINNIISNNDNFYLSVSLTTRKKRDTEVDGINYYFVSKEVFLDNIKNNNLLEYAEVYKDIYYGTLKDKVLEKLDSGFNVILEIDVCGAMNVKKNMPSALLIFILPPSIEELKKRLINRNTDSMESINERISKAQYEIEQSKYYDYVVTNHNINDTSLEILNIINNN